MPPFRTMVLGAFAVGAQAFSSTPMTMAPTPSPTPMPTAPTTTTGGLPPCGTIDDNGLNCQGLKSKKRDAYDDGCGGDYDYYGWYMCDCTTVCCSDDDAVFENGECDTTLSGR